MQKTLCESRDKKKTKIGILKILWC